MQHIQKLTCHQTGNTLFEGHYSSLRECIESAIKQNVDLTNIDLSYENLSEINCDGAIIKHAKFRGTNLSGANLSEAVLDYSDFTDAALYNTCFCESSLKNCIFFGASFGGTDISGAELSASSFSTLSAFDLDFIHARSVSACTYCHIDGETTQFSTPPLVLKGVLNTPVIIFEKIIKIGTHRFLLPTPLSQGKKIIEDLLLQALHKSNEQSAGCLTVPLI